MILFCSDLDNTLIYSYRHEIGKDKICVEYYQGREASYMTHFSYQMLKKVTEKILFVPLTTRTIEQYERIDFGVGTCKYALVCNGGILLEDGKRDMDWYEQSKMLIADCMEELQKAIALLQTDEYRSMEVRFIEDLFVFTKSEDREKTVRRLQEHMNTQKIDIFQNGNKIYAVPKALSKGEAVKRIRKKLMPEYVIAAGDSEFDVSMLGNVQCPILPEELAENYFVNKNQTLIKKDRVYSDGLLEYILQMDCISFNTCQKTLDFIVR